MCQNTPQLPPGQAPPRKGSCPGGRPSLRARGSSEPETGPAAAGGMNGLPSPLEGISANLTPLRKRGARGDLNVDSECCGMLRVLKDRHVNCARV